MKKEIFTGERFIPGIEDDMLTLEHVQRYESIKELIKDKNVLDAACGEGYGSCILSEYAGSVVGLDISEETIENARKKYADITNLQFVHGSIAKLPIKDNSIDVVVSFETIEHVGEDIQKCFLEEISRVLKTDGLLIMSTPNKKIYSDIYDYHNEFHIREFYENEFYDFLSQRFKNIKFFNQFFEVAGIISNKSTKKNTTIFNWDDDYKGEGKYVIALASNSNIEDKFIQSVSMVKEKMYQTYTERIIKLQNSEEERNQHIWKLDKEIADLREVKKAKELEMAELKTEKEAEINAQKELIEKLEIELRNKEGHIELLLESERAFEREKQSRCYKIGAWLRRVVGFLIPSGSKREFFLYVLYQCFRHPLFMLRMINLIRIKNFFIVARKEGMEGVWQNYHMAENFEKLRLNKTAEIEVIEVDEKPLDEYQILEFTSWEEPLVSIIIPVYNQFGYTYRCLESILRNSGNVRYEVIIANDCSTDQTKELDKVVHGIKILNNKENLRFLKNCNNAARYAKGKYILFLNNDTQVQDNWLGSLLDIIENDDTVGMVGSKLVYPDGYLQEAGGILWKDGSAWNYGHRESPEEAEFNYVKEADYISGAAMMIRKSLWCEIGGFDETFAPAYYEDTDLAFEVRKHGYKVVYQPLSVVVHFEGVSNGTDVSQGIKAYQVENQKKFYKKWKNVLQEEHFPNGENVFLAKDRSRLKKQILVVDHYVPNHDKDAGGKGTYMYLKAFLKMGMKVTFIGDNFAKMEPYATELNQLGVEILYGNYYYNNWQEWLKQNLHYFDYVYLQRPHISIKYIDLVKEYSNAKIFYYAVDLHYLREYRQYQLDHNPETLKSSEYWKKIEYELFEKTDVGHVVGSYEQEIMQKAFPDKPVRNIPLYIYEDELNDIQKDFSQRENIMYVGGFGHPPNEDAVLWFAKEVFPKVLEKYPNMKWHVVGSKVTKVVQELASDNIIIEGFLSDEDLHKLYRTCRMAIVPLRYGAGVKGKVVESAYFQIPLVTTSIGAEGLDCTDEPFVVEDDADKMAEKICALYEDFDKLKEFSDKGKVFIQKFFTLEVATDVLKADMDR